MTHDSIVFSVFLIFSGAAVLAGLALYARQSMLVAYIALGLLAGPHALGLIEERATIEGIGHVGIIFLLFLLGLNLHPQKLGRMLREATRVTLLSSACFWAIGFALAHFAFGFGIGDAAIIGAACVFSSTIIGLKLMPTTALHHRHVGEVIISVLLLQDVIAIVLIVVISAAGGGATAESGSSGFVQAALAVLALPLLCGAAFVLERYVLMPVLGRFDTVGEYVFLAAVGWCLGIAQAGRALGLSYEMGAFIAGVALARSPIALYIAESLKPLRDFFLVMFFFSLGAGFALPMVGQVALPALALGAAMLLAKPVVFRLLLSREQETAKLSREVGARLGQMSEFSLLLAVVALGAGTLSERAFYFIETATIVTLIVSSYLIMLRFPTPIAVSDRLRAD